MGVKFFNYLNILYNKKLIKILDWVDGVFFVCNFSGLYMLGVNFFLMYLVIVLARLNIFRQLVDFYASHYLNFYSLYFVLRTFEVGIFNFFFFIKSMYKLRTFTLYYPAVNWLEREMWDMFGLTFTNNLNHVRILTDYGFDSFPLRKDYPLVGYVEYFFDLEIKSLVYRNVYLLQEFRFYTRPVFWYSNKIVNNYQVKKNI